jgi:hypothetical protein
MTRNVLIPAAAAFPDGSVASRQRGALTYPTSTPRDHRLTRATAASRVAMSAN